MSVGRGGGEPTRLISRIVGSRKRHLLCAIGKVDFTRRFVMASCGIGSRAQASVSLASRSASLLWFFLSCMAFRLRRVSWVFRWRSALLDARRRRPFVAFLARQFGRGRPSGPRCANDLFGRDPVVAEIRLPPRSTPRSLSQSMLLVRGFVVHQERLRCRTASRPAAPLRFRSYFSSVPGGRVIEPARPPRRGLLHQRCAGPLPPFLTLYVVL